MSGIERNRSRELFNGTYANKAAKDARENPKPAIDTGKPVASKSAQFGTSGSSGLGASTSGTAPGGIDYDAYVAGPSFSIDGSAKATVGKGGVSIDVNIDIEATLIEAGANATKTFKAEVAGEEFEVTVDLAALGKVGVDGHLNLSLDIGPKGVEISASVEGFAGAQASITGGITLTHEGREIASGEATLSAQAGVSGSANADLSFKGGNIAFEASASATAGVGFGVDVSGNVNTGNAARAATEVFTGALREGVDDVAETAAEFAHATGDFLGDRAEDLKDFAQDAGGFVIDKTGKVLNKAGEVWESRPDWLF